MTTEHKNLCITTLRANTKSDANSNPNTNPTTKQHAIVNIQISIVACTTYPKTLYTKRRYYTVFATLRCHFLIPVDLGALFDALAPQKLPEKSLP